MLILLALIASWSSAAEIITLQQNSLDLNWNQALSQGLKTGKPFLVGYRIETLRQQNSIFWIGSGNIHISSGSFPTLQQQLDGQTPTAQGPQRPFADVDTPKKRREVALLFSYRIYDRKTYLVEVDISYLDQPGHLEHTTYWLGERNLKQSFKHVRELYQQHREQRPAPALIEAAAYHNLSAATDFLAGIINGQSPRSHREEAASSLGTSAIPEPWNWPIRPPKRMVPTMYAKKQWQPSKTSAPLQPCIT